MVNVKEIFHVFLFLFFNRLYGHFFGHTLYNYHIFYLFPIKYGYLSQLIKSRLSVNKKPMIDMKNLNVARLDCMKSDSSKFISCLRVKLVNFFHPNVNPYG